MKVAVVGTGYVGLVTGVVLAHLKHDVICVDKDAGKVEKLREGISPIYEPGIEEMIAECQKAGHLTFTTDLPAAAQASDIVFIAVGTPPSEDGSPDMTAVKAVAREIGKSIKKYTLVVNKSTVPVGSGDLVENILNEQGADHALFDVVSNPEFLREGTAIWDTLNPDRIVIGAKSQEAAQKLVDLYKAIDTPVLITDLESAEMIKYASNSFLAMKISYINAISRICELCGGDVEDVAKGMGLDRRIGSMFLQSGLGWGGSCFPKDVTGLMKVAGSLGYDFRLLHEVNAINDDQTLNFVRRLEERLGGFEGKTIGLLGLAFKPNTDDIRDAKSLVIIQQILSRGGKVQAFDPVAADHVKAVYPQIAYSDSALEVAEGADALILVTEWEEFASLDLAKAGSKMRSKIFFDGRRQFKREKVEAAGFEYYTIGSRTQTAVTSGG